MASETVDFGPFRVDWDNHTIHNDAHELRVTPKAFAVLRYLLARPGQVVTKEELLRSVWPSTIVSEAALTVCIRELRRVFGDSARAPQYLETVHRRGFRFIGPVQGPRSKVQGPTFEPAPSPQHPAPPLVGRAAELSHLHQLLEKARSGERQIVFVTGEPGIGKTALLDAFVFGVQSHEPFGVNTNPKSKIPGPQLRTPNSELSPTPDPRPLTPNPWLAQGQCIEQFGPGEPYLPLLAALGELGRGPAQDRLVTTLRQYAPTWLMQLSALATPADRAALQVHTFGATRERMLRELAEGLEALTRDTVLILTLEDLHWSDPSTQDALSFLARRRHPARLLVLGTYRPTEVLGNGHPLRTLTQDLAIHRHSVELPVPLLTEAAVAEYLAIRARPLQPLARTIHHRTSGNPLFMVNVVEDLLLHGPATNDGPAQAPLNVPATIRQMLERQIDQLSTDEHQLLVTASAVGTEFAAATIAPSLARSVTTVEEHCASLARREHFVRATGTTQWPDGTTSARYSFRHALYHDVLYERVTPSQRLQVHQQIGARLEQGYGDRAEEIAAALAVHFEQARDYPRAVQYHGQAGRTALGRSAAQEAIGHLTTALDLLTQLPDSPERIHLELSLLMPLGAAFMNVKGFAAVEMERAYSRAHTLCEQLGNTPHLFPVLHGLAIFYVVRAKLGTARTLIERSLPLAQQTQNPVLLLEAYKFLGQILLFQGELLGSRHSFDQALTLYDPRQHRHHAFLYGQDPGGLCLTLLSAALWIAGYPEQAWKKAQAAVALARQQGHLFTLGFALLGATMAHRWRGDELALRETAEEFQGLATEQGFAFLITLANHFRAWRLAKTGYAEQGVTQICRDVAMVRASGAEQSLAYSLALSIEIHEKAGRIDEALDLAEEALTLSRETGNCWLDAELYQLKGELLLAQESKSRKLENPSPQPLAPNTQAEAEECFHKAIAIARQQSAKSWELRATMSLARLWQQQGKQQEAHQMLSEVYNWFTEGFDTADLREAKALLEELRM